MGIDAEMFLRLKGSDRLDESTVAQLSYELASSLYGNVVWVSREYNRHALSIVGTYEDEDGVYPQLKGQVVYLDDTTEPKVARPEEQFINVGLYGRYYGPDYERGDFASLYAVTKWLRVRIPAAEIWYGGDSSGIAMAPFDEEKMLWHWAQTGNRPYQHYFGRNKGQRPVCTFCPDIDMVNSGGGGDRTFWHCDGCGVKVITSPAGIVEVDQFFRDEQKVHKEVTQVWWHRNRCE